MASFSGTWVHLHPTSWLCIINSLYPRPLITSEKYYGTRRWSVGMVLAVKLEGLSSNSQHPQEKLDIVACLCDPSTGKAKAGITLRLASQSV